MSQPLWKRLGDIGDVNPVEYGGGVVYEDTTGVYDPELHWIEPDSDEDDSPVHVYRCSLDRCTFIDGILSNNPFHPDRPAWFAKPESERATRPQDTTYLADVIKCCDHPDLAAHLCSADVVTRALAYWTLASYYGWENFDSYPLEMAADEARTRYTK